MIFISVVLLSYPVSFHFLTAIISAVIIIPNNSYLYSTSFATSFVSQYSCNMPMDVLGPVALDPCTVYMLLEYQQVRFLFLASNQMLIIGLTYNMSSGS